jgi:SAM-dependent methyltransferase
VDAAFEHQPRFGRLISYTDALLQRIAPEGSVLDIGCIGFRPVQQARALGLTSQRHFGVDYVDPPEGTLPEGFQFRRVDLNQERLPYQEDSFDLVIASHVMEHLAAPLPFFREAVRVLKPGGLLYVETPSERSLMLPGMFFKLDEFHSLSFFDDPTHCFRPWSPQSLQRLTRYYGCEPAMVGYRTSWRAKLLFPAKVVVALLRRDATMFESAVWQAIGWASFLILRKPTTLRGEPPFNYYIPH